MTFEQTQYGFRWGPLEVTRLCSEEKHGCWLRVQGVKQFIDVRVTKGGRVRLVSPISKTPAS